jgi:hypothetical protein
MNYRICELKDRRSGSSIQHALEIAYHGLSSCVPVCEVGECLWDISILNDDGLTFNGMLTIFVLFVLFFILVFLLCKVPSMTYTPATILFN